MEVDILKQELLSNLSNYMTEGIDQVLKAFELAKDLHSMQKRQSGEPYIIHPLSVAIILSEMKADVDTICAGLLHDTLEDTVITKQELIHDFNPVVADLVDGVTKISKLNFSSKQDRNYANTRKIISSITEDVRIIIKLADRLHNMRTLEYKTEFKQKENALETMELFVPLAYYIGAYRIKSEFEDLSLKYLKTDEYKKTKAIYQKIEENSKYCLSEMLFNIQKLLENEQIPYHIKTRIKNIYGLYKKIYVYTTSGDIIGLPKGSAPIDFAYRIHTEVGNSMVGVFVNDDKVSIYDELHNKDRVRIITSEYSVGPGRDWEEKVKTTQARRKIREFNKKYK